MRRIVCFLRVTLLWIALLPFALGFVGAASNQLVVIANHDRFPVMANAIRLQGWDDKGDGMLDDIHCVMTPETHLNFLADIFDFAGTIESPGDLLIDAGGDIYHPCLIIWATLAIRRLCKRTAS